MEFLDKETARSEAVQANQPRVSCVPRLRAPAAAYLFCGSPLPSPPSSGVCLSLSLSACLPCLASRRVPPGVARALGRRRRGRAGASAVLCNFAGLIQEKGRPSSRFYSPFRRSLLSVVFFLTTYYTTTTTTPGRPAASKACKRRVHALPPTPIRPAKTSKHHQLLLSLLYSFVCFSALAQIMQISCSLFFFSMQALWSP